MPDRYLPSGDGALRSPLPSTFARQDIELFTEVATVFDLTTHAVLEATRVAVRDWVPIWDALIWPVPATNGIAVVLTEDIRDAIEGVRFVNPFDSNVEVAVP